MSKKKKVSKTRSEYRYDLDDERSIFEEMTGFLTTFLVGTIIILLVTTLLFRPNVVSGRSMFPTLYPEDKGFSNVLALATEGIERNDIVTAKMLNDEDGKEYDVVKRVIALPGETVECKDETLYVNGKAVDESAYLNEEYIQSCKEEYGYFNQDFGPVTLEENEYFLMGDNRPISKDSRDVGAFDKSDIQSKDFLVLMPFSRMSYYQ